MLQYPQHHLVTPLLCHNGLKVNAQCPHILVLGSPCKSTVVTVKADVCMLLVVLTIAVIWLPGDYIFSQPMDLPMLPPLLCTAMYHQQL